MRIKVVMSLFFCLLSLTTVAQAVPPLAISTYGNVTLSQKKLITDVFLYLNKFWADKGKSLSRSVTARYFTPDTTLIINGKTVYSGFNQFDAHFKAVGKNIMGKIRFPLLKVISVDNKLIVHFNEDLHDNNGNYYPTNVMAIFTLHNNKIQQWEEVVNSKYFCLAKSIKVVYSK